MRYLFAFLLNRIVTVLAKKTARKKCILPELAFILSSRAINSFLSFL